MEQLFSFWIHFFHKNSLFDVGFIWKPAPHVELSRLLTNTSWQSPMSENVYNGILLDNHQRIRLSWFSRGSGIRNKYTDNIETDRLPWEERWLIRTSLSMSSSIVAKCAPRLTLRNTHQLRLYTPFSWQTDNNCCSTTEGGRNLSDSLQQKSWPISLFVNIDQ